jgi:glycosyltransferase domain-containing protein
VKKFYKKKLINKLTLILSTNNNREKLIFRFLDYYELNYGYYKLSIVISDDGNKKGYISLKRKIKSKNYNLNISVLNYRPKNNPLQIARDGWGKPRFEYRDRFKQALRLVTTSYIALSADDDFYFPGYFTKAINFLDKDKSYSCVYGHQISFSLKKYTAFGKITKINVAKENNPPNPWQEDDIFLDRLNNLGKNPWSWFNWYAIQRKEVLNKTILKAKKYNIDGYLFEKFFTFCHAVMYKTKKINFVYNARQENPIYNEYVGREPFSYFRNIKSLNNFKKACVEFLTIKHKTSQKYSNLIINEITKKDFNSYIMNDIKEIPRALKKRYLIRLKKLNLITKVKPQLIEDPRLKTLSKKNIQKETCLLKKIVEINK